MKTRQNSYNDKNLANYTKNYAKQTKVCFAIRFHISFFMI